MRQIVIDTETTGLYPQQGHRIIELAALEMVSRRPTGEIRRWYLNPERDIDADAVNIHGLTLEKLKDQPLFADIADEFVSFCQGAEWIIHNAPFDIAFLDAELARLDKLPCAQIYGSLIDTLQKARTLFPGKRNNLDALCERFGISNAHRTLHGACLDAQLLAEVYLALTRGQESLIMAPSLCQPKQSSAAAVAFNSTHPLKILRASNDEQAAHHAYLAALRKDGRCLWDPLEEKEFQ
ncbi:MAG: DNA polymerase III subunit epsilon [Burkholderiales bacterium]|jgi:DNA polymerase-3 subunit epsilon|nr:DNA polymerase III subunit epsilon [Burkholderiales bacterium]